MIPPMNCIRYLGSADFNTGIARTVVDELALHLSGSRGAGTVSARYEQMCEYVERFMKIMLREKDTDLKVETVAAVTKHWVANGWGADLMSDPRNGTPFKWKVSEKSFDYNNGEKILPTAEAPLADGKFPEFRPYGSIPGTMRLFKGKTLWWVTDNGTHGNVAECRGASWWVWPMQTARWHRWTITGSTRAGGAGATGLAVGLPGDVDLTMSKQERYLISLLKANFNNEMDDKHFSSKQVWSDALVMTTD